MNTLNLSQAAAFLHCDPETVRQLAADHIVPGHKVGRAWVFVDVDLVDWLRKQYGRTEKCGYTNVGITGGPTSVSSTAKELERALAPKTNRRRFNGHGTIKANFGAKEN